ncbi:MAG: hypothetical protein WD187_00405 [Candidatus Woykebacteria bacterium]
MKFNQVTWYSKLAALILFITLPFIGFCGGVWYQKSVFPPQTKIIEIQQPPETSTGSALPNE